MGNKGFRQYFSDLELDHIGYVIVCQPEFFRNVSSLLEHVPLKEWKIFLKWRIILFAAPYLSMELEEENFDFFYRKLMGLKEMPRRWKNIVRLTDHLFGEALGKIFVDLKFTEDSKKRMEEMVADLKDAFEDRLQNLEWMSLATREKALEKFKKFRVKIGYPSKFIDYSSIRIEPDDFFGNVVRATEFEMSRMLKLIGKEVDRELWGMTPPAVNAYFSPTDNEVVFPAGILQPPFFDPDMDDAVNYGATGGTIAHELTHGFDDEGRKFDSNGNLGNWWTKGDEQKFDKKAKQVVELYSSINVLPGININGKLTLGENIADIGGVAIALEALEKRLRKHPERNVKIDGFTPVQRFFLGWTQDRRSNSTEDFLKMLLLNNHSPDNIRTDIPCMVCKKFDGAFREFSKLDKSNVPKIEIW
jgi:predicted metalloendopeptidase